MYEGSMATSDNKPGSAPDSNHREESQSGVNSGGMLFFVLSMVATFGAMIYVSFFSGGIDLKEIKPIDTAAVEQKVAEAPVDVSGVTEPWMPNPDMVKHGAAIFKTNCAMCHGAEGKGDGIAGKALNPPPRNLVEGKWKQGGGELAMFATLQNGIPGSSMQGYKDALPLKDRWALVQFIHSITENKVNDSEADLKAKAPALK
jgi:mono/diheme cytochrome c family protein